ncbi:MAG: hypothetical protein DME43_12515 [Verrucomicrobia bacterium]|nr:MAG: hypothetical protein DME43_12515 [Verrucomicrobiota bacterium]
MTKAESELAEALRERLKIISDETSRRDPDQHVKRLQEISKRIETLAAALPQPAPSRLAHFLERRSYDKALDLLEDGGD